MGYLGNRYLISAALESEFGEFNGASGDFCELCPLEEGFSWSFGGPQMLDKPLMRADAANSPAHAGVRRPEVKFTLQARGAGVPAGHGAAAQLCRDLDAPLAACLGAARVAVGSGIVSASSASNVTLSSAASLRAGEIVWVDPDGDGVTYPRAVAAINGAAVELWPELPKTPASGGVVYAACNFTPFCGPVQASMCLEKSSAVWAGKRLVERVCGMAGSVALARTGAREQLLLKFSLEGVDDECVETTGGALPGSSAASHPWSPSPAPVRASGAHLYMGSAELHRHSSFEYEPGAEIKLRDDVTSASGAASHFVSSWAEKGVLHMPWSASIRNLYESGTTFRMLWACGDAANGVGLYIPSAQIMEIGRETMQGEEYMKLSFRAVRDALAPARCLAFSGRRN